MKRFPVTAHVIVANEDRFVRYAIQSVLPFVEKILIYDTGSVDKTVDQIKSLMSSLNKEERKRVQFEQKIIQLPADIGKLRIDQVKKTKTAWFLLVDGDEIWPEEQLLQLLELTKDKRLKKQTLAVVNRTRDCVGDVWHYRPEKAGGYHFLGRTGHYTIRLMRTMDYTMEGTYPNEGYHWQDKLINAEDEWLEFCDVWYLHTTHLQRSSTEASTWGHRKRVIEIGLAMTQEELPNVLRIDEENSTVLGRRSFAYELVARPITWLKAVKNWL